MCTVRATCVVACPLFFILTHPTLPYPTLPYPTLDPSELLSVKMLQGWALLEQCCQKESCAGVPLVRDKEGVVQCVVCGIDGKGRDSSPTHRSNAPKPAAAASTAVRFADLDDEDDDDEDEDFDAADDNVAFSDYAAKRITALAGSAVGEAPAASASANANANASAGYKSSSSSSSHININSTAVPPVSVLNTHSNNNVLEAPSPLPLPFVSNVLKSQMRNAAEGLQTASGVRHATALAELITKLAVALKAVDGL